jgi:hypothetical protein
MNHWSQLTLTRRGLVTHLGAVTVMQMDQRTVIQDELVHVVHSEGSEADQLHTVTAPSPVIVSAHAFSIPATLALTPAARRTRSTGTPLCQGGS